MRPQHIAAENGRVQIVNATADGGFNEAAAYRCGKPGADTFVFYDDVAASMRPQHIAAENAASGPPRTTGPGLQ